MKRSAGILVFRRSDASVELLLAHPGGPIWGKRDVWSIPKGELDENEQLEAAARREFEEEIGLAVPAGELIDLGSAKQSGGKTNFVWAVEGDIDLAKFSCNTFTMEWPPKSGQFQEFPENDRAAWFAPELAVQKLFPAQVVFIERLAEKLGLDIQPPEQ